MRLKLGSEPLQQFFLGQSEILVVRFQVIPAIDDVLAVEIVFGNEIGVLHQRQERKTLSLWQVVPVIAFLRELVLERDHQHHRAQAFQLQQPLAGNFPAGPAPFSPAVPGTK